MLTNKIKQLLLLLLFFMMFSCSLDENKEEKIEKNYANTNTVIEDDTSINTVSTGAFNN